MKLLCNTSNHTIPGQHVCKTASVTQIVGSCMGALRDGILQHVSPPPDADTFKLIHPYTRCNLHHETHLLMHVSPHVSTCVGPFTVIDAA
jgi:hypothetical protein